ncbi:hypothetical protein L6164_000479 [Bauhinia variegata]|uniref:Uncharacterized protein n=1 Tax=Bauhinia variegata TaxID=167791 RepID=A0ACB9Q621_BAUVA|nr:hypothetical protein L6164_000479 [Bauhinia variegata]
MASSRVSQSYLVAILFLVLAFASGPASGMNFPDIACQGPCGETDHCDAQCKTVGFVNGGVCLGFDGAAVRDYTCCCVQSQHLVGVLSTQPYDEMDDIECQGPCEGRVECFSQCKNIGFTHGGSCLAFNASPIGDFIFICCCNKNTIDYGDM